MLGNVLRGEAKVDQLANNTHPVFVALLLANAVDRQLVVAHIADTLVIGAAQHLHHVAHPEALIHTVNGRERLTRVHQTIVLFRRIQADIAVAARLLAPFTKVVEQHQTTAGLRFGKRAHRVELVALDILQLSLRLLFQTAAQPRHIGRIVKQHRFRRQTVTPGAAGFLIVGFDIARDVEMHHKAHVRLVDAHSERHGRDDDLQVVTLEFLLHVGADVIL